MGAEDLDMTRFPLTTPSAQLDNILNVYKGQVVGTYSKGAMRRKKVHVADARHRDDRITKTPSYRR